MNYQRFKANMGYTAYLAGLLTLFVFRIELNNLRGILFDLVDKSRYFVLVLPLALVVTYYIINALLALFAILLEKKNKNTEYLSDADKIDDITGSFMLAVMAFLIFVNCLIKLHEYFKTHPLLMISFMIGGAVIAYIAFTLRKQINKGLIQINESTQSVFDSSREVNFMAISLSLGSLIALIYTFIKVLKKYGLEASHYELFVLAFCVVPVIVYFTSAKLMMKHQDSKRFINIVKTIVTIIVSMIMILIGIFIYYLIKVFTINGLTLENYKFMIFIMILILAEVGIFVLLKKYLKDEL